MNSSTRAALPGAAEREQPGQASFPPFDPQVANVARVYDYLLGGKQHFEADRAFAKELIAQVPDVRAAARANRGFLGRAARFLAGERGICQFVDLGCGLPTQANTHEVVQAENADSHVVYVDYDPLVISHAQALLSPRYVTAFQGDLRDPEAILSDPRLRIEIDLSQPVAVFLVAVLHFVSDDEDPSGIVRTISSQLAPGSYVVISHATGEGFDEKTSEAIADMYRDSSSATYPRSAKEVEHLFAGLELVPPGITDVAAWPSPAAAHVAARTMFLGGVGRVL